MGQAPDLLAGKSTALHQQCVGVLRALVRFITGLSNSRMCRDVSFRSVSHDAQSCRRLSTKCSCSLVTTTIADIYFVHQRGLRLAMWGLCLSVGVGGGSIISGYIIQGVGKRDMPL